ncbi:MAG: hypothetical protein HYX68_20230 [Planctomycetes bacterium]|jgi:hypothetical protein|nr:hypothetical protein [Planctomycetota bacterium]
MLKATLRKGAIVPLEPLPPDWHEGAALEIEKSADVQIDIDVWVKLMKELCADSPMEEDGRMQAAIDEHRLAAKEQVRREMGLSQ